jgi:hypothetical protein
MRSHSNATTRKSVNITYRPSTASTSTLSKRRPNSEMSFRGSFDRAENVKVLRANMGFGGNVRSVSPCVTLRQGISSQLVS